MKPATKHRIAQKQVEAFLRRLHKEDREMLLCFPRPIEAIVPLVFPAKFESVAGLTERLAADILRTRHRWDGGLATGEDRHLGLLVANDQRAVIFSSPDHGSAAELFTKAHELGHLALEHLPRLPASNQQDLFGDVPKPVTTAKRDGADTIPTEYDAVAPPTPVRDLGRMKANSEERRKETYANLFACEFLAPLDRIGEFARSYVYGQQIDERSLVEAFMARFGLSRMASTILLDDLEVIQSREKTSFLL